MSQENISLYDKYSSEIRNCIRSALSQSEKNVFEALIDLFRSHFEKPAHNISEIKARSTKMKGDIFEVFCVMYLRQKGYTVWMLSDLPDEMLNTFKLDRKDHGIDLIAKLEKEGKEDWYCVQCKYRKKTKNSLGETVHRINWRDISTFLALASKTGPPRKGWKKNIVMTNADYVCWKGKKSIQDYTIAKRTFQNLSRSFWSEMIGLRSHSLKEKEDNEEKEKDDEEKKDNRDLRNLREKWLDRMFPK